MAVFNCSHRQSQPPQSSFPPAAKSRTSLHHRLSQPIIHCSPAQPEAFLNTLRLCRVSLVVASMMRSVSHTNQNPVEVSGFLCQVSHCSSRAGQLVYGVQQAGVGLWKKDSMATPVGMTYSMMSSYTALRWLSSNSFSTGKANSVPAWGNLFWIWSSVSAFYRLVFSDFYNSARKWLFNTIDWELETQTACMWCFQM